MIVLGTCDVFNKFSRFDANDLEDAADDAFRTVEGPPLNPL